jgi:hypothetical protein
MMAGMAGFGTPALRAFNRRMSAGRKTRGFMPFQPETSPPPDRYDPALDAQLGNANRGLAYHLDDLATAGERANSQLGIGTESVQRGQGRTLADLLREQMQAGQDYRTNTDALGRRFMQQGQGQAQAASASGLSVGALQAAAAARAQNQGRAQAQLDTAFQRLNQSIDTQRQRVNEDAGLSLADLQRQYGYGVADRSTDATRSQIENANFGLDIGKEKFFQAGQTGYASPGPPSNEFTDANGNPYQVRVEGGQDVGYDPQGNVLFRRDRTGGDRVLARAMGRRTSGPSMRAPAARVPRRRFA